jgi:ubiquinone/menaquinone biosynthesis C-methylase UbiE
MSGPTFSETTYGGTGPENYERFFVPAIGRPMATDLIDLAALQPGERVLDVACGTGIVARLAREKIGAGATLAGLDPDPGMLAVAGEVAAGTGIEWHPSSAESMPLSDASFDVVLSQMGLQFVPDKAAAVKEIARVLAPGGRVALNVVGPRPGLMSVLADALATHVSSQSSKFVDVVFSLHDTGRIESLLANAGLRDVTVTSRIKTLELPPPADFLWQYIQSTPLRGVVAQVGADARAALQDEVLREWRAFMRNGTLVLELPVIEATAKESVPG